MKALRCARETGTSHLDFVRWVLIHRFPGNGTCPNRRCLQLKKLHVVKLGRGFAWLDTGTHDALLEASEFVRSIQHRQGVLVGCPEEVAYLRGFITADQLRSLAVRCGQTVYGRYLQRLADEQA